MSLNRAPYEVRFKPVVHDFIPHNCFSRNATFSDGGMLGLVGVSLNHATRRTILFHIASFTSMDSILNQKLTFCRHLLFHTIEPRRIQ